MVVVGIFEDQESAETAVNRLNALDIDQGDIHVMTRNDVEGNRSLLGTVAGALSAGTTPLEGRLTNLGLSSEEATFYEQELGDESVLIAVKADDDLGSRVTSALREANGVVRS